MGEGRVTRDTECFNTLVLEDRRGKAGGADGSCERAGQNSHAAVARRHWEVVAFALLTPTFGILLSCYVRASTLQL